MRGNDYSVRTIPYTLEWDNDDGDYCAMDIKIQILEQKCSDPYSTGDFWFSTLEYEAHWIEDEDGDKIESTDIIDIAGEEAYNKLVNFVLEEV